MQKFVYTTGGHLMGYRSAAILPDGSEEDPRSAIVEDAIQTISTDVEITVAEVTMHLAAWQDPDHWESDWREKAEAHYAELGIDFDAEDFDADSFISELIDEAREDG